MLRTQPTPFGALSKTGGGTEAAVRAQGHDTYLTWAELRRDPGEVGSRAELQKIKTLAGCKKGGKAEQAETAAWDRPREGNIRKRFKGLRVPRGICHHFQGATHAMEKVAAAGHICW